MIESIDIERLRGMAETVPGVVYQLRLGVTGEFSFAYVSEAVREYFLLGSSELSQSAAPWFERIHPDDRARSAATYARAAERGAPFVQEHRIRGRDGAYRWFLVRGEPYRDPARQNVSHTFLAFDIAWFMPVDDYRARMGRFIDTVRSSRLRPGFSEILVPGELEHRRVLEKTANGVPLDRDVYDDLVVLGHELGVTTSLQPVTA